MAFEWLNLPFSLPETRLSLAGFLFTLLLLCGIAVILVRSARKPLALPPARWAGLAGLLVAAVLAPHLVVVRLPATTDLPQGFLTTIPLLGLVPVGIAALSFPLVPTMAVGGISGLSWAVAGTGRLSHPLELILLGSALFWALGQHYQGWLSRWLRQPAIAFPLLAFLIGWPLAVLGAFMALRAPVLSRLELTLRGAAPTLLAVMGAALAAGILLQAADRLFKLRPPLQADALTVPAWQQNLRQRILLAAVSAVSLAIVALGITTTLVAYHVATRLAVRQMAQEASIASRSVAAFVRSGVEEIADQRSLQPASGLPGEPSFFQALIFISGQNDQIISVPPNAVEQSPLTTEEIRAVAIPSAELAIDGVTVIASSAASEPVISFIAPVSAAASGSSPDTIIGRITLSQNIILNSALRSVQAESPQREGGISIVDSNGTVLYSTGSGLDAGLLASLVGNHTAGGSLARHVAKDGTRDLTYTAPISSTPGWLVVVNAPNEAVLAQATEMAWPLVALLLLLEMASWPVAMVVSRQVAAPIGALLAAVEALSEANLEAPISVRGEDEIGRLGVAFDRMRAHLKDRLDEQERLLRVSRSVASSLELFRVVPPILSSALEVAQAVGVRIVVKPGEGKPLETYSAGDAAALMSVLDAQIVELVEKQGTVVISQLWRTTSLDTAALPSYIQALLALPLRSESAFYGALWLAYDREHAFEQPEMTFLSTLAGQVAVAIANSHLFAEAQEERRKLEAVLSSTADALIVADNQGRIVLMNPAAELYLDKPLEQARGLRAEEVIDVSGLAALLTDLQEPVSVLELPGRRGRTLLANASTIIGQDGVVAGRVAVLRDVTAFKELDNIKTVFLRMVSHDLRSPLTYMRGYLSMLPLTGELNDRQQEAIQKIGGGIDSISELTERLLYLSRLQFGDEAQLDLALVDIEALIKEVILIQEPFARDKEIDILLDIEPKLPLLPADEMLLRQAIVNLLSNAIKYSPTGGEVRMHASQEQTGDGTQIAIAVTDRGIGIRPEDQAHLFEAFFRVPQREGEPARPRGHGLGLALVKAVATAHNGTVGVESDFGRGSTFTITVPVRKPDDL